MTANAAFLTAIRQDPVLASAKLVAEPWDHRHGRLPGRRISLAMVGME